MFYSCHAKRHPERWRNLRKPQKVLRDIAIIMGDISHMTVYKAQQILKSE